MNTPVKILIGVLAAIGAVLVNGKQLKRLDVERRPYRLRLLNASNSRTYELAWKELGLGRLTCAAAMPLAVGQDGTPSYSPEKGHHGTVSC